MVVLLIAVNIILTPIYYRFLAIVSICCYNLIYSKGAIPMKYSTKVSDAVHILSFIALNAKESLTSQAIAESVKRTLPS